jgi:hypothetical protein
VKQIYKIPGTGHIDNTINRHMVGFTISAAVFRIHDILMWIRIRGSMPLTTGSGSCYFRSLPSRRKQKIIIKSFSAYYFLKIHLNHFSKIKILKKSQHRRNRGFSYYFCLMIEGSGSIPLASGSGSGRPKNMWIWWIRSLIRNTDQQV